MPNLLVDISQTGLAAGLEEKLFQPATEQKTRLLRRAADQASGSPAAITSSASSSSGIAALPRIVTLHDIEIKPAAAGKDSDAG